MEKGAKMKININVENGTLSNEELKKLVQCIRDIEQNNPVRTIYIWIDAPDKKIEEMKELIDSVKPGFSHKAVFDFRKEGK